MVLICLNFIFKQSCRNWTSVFVTSLIILLFIGLTWKYAIEQSKSQIDLWLSDKNLMLDTAVLVCMDVLLQAAFCVIDAHIQTSVQVSRKLLYTYRFLKWYPGILIFPVLFCLLVYVIFAATGHDFAVVAWVTATVSGCAVPLLTYLVRKIFPDKEIRMEFLFITNILIAAIGIVATVNGKVTTVDGSCNTDWTALTCLIALIVSGALCGLISYRIKLNKIK